jgi:hypothetical protein
MAYRFDRSKVLSAGFDEWMSKTQRRPFSKFIKRYGLCMDPNPCPFCDTSPRDFQHHIQWEPGVYKDCLIRICPSCLWFRFNSFFCNSDLERIIVHHYGTYQPDKRSIDSLPVSRLADLLAHRWKDHSLISPGQAEDLVAQVFAEHLNCQVHYVTNGVYAPDGGIDFVLVEAETGLEYAFQVKRRLTSKPERVQPVREFLGSLAGTKYERGYFVTFAPAFTRNTHRELAAASSQLRHRNLDIRLIDGSRLKSILAERRRKSLAAHPLPSLKEGRNTIVETGWREVPLGTSTASDAKAAIGPPLSPAEILAEIVKCEESPPGSHHSR